MKPRLPKEEESALSAVRTLIKYLGDNPDRSGVLETPKRVLKSYKELFGGYTADVKAILKTFEEPCDQMVILSDIEFYSTCEHHMIPFVGRATVAYLPSRGRVVGVSKLARILEAYSRRLQIQERIGQQVVEALDTHLQPLGAACILHAKHFCMCARGVGKQNSMMTTSALSGVYKDDPSARAELLALLPRS